MSEQGSGLGEMKYRVEWFHISDTGGTSRHWTEERFDSEKEALEFIESMSEDFEILNPYWSIRMSRKGN